MSSKFLLVTSVGFSEFFLGEISKLGDSVSSGGILFVKDINVLKVSFESGESS